MRRLSSDLLEAPGQHRLLELAPERALAAEPQVLRHLLRDGRRAAIEAAGVEIGRQRVADAIDVEAVVREEAAVLGDEEGAHHRRRQRVERAPRRIPGRRAAAGRPSTTWPTSAGASARTSDATSASAASVRARQPLTPLTSSASARRVVDVARDLHAPADVAVDEETVEVRHQRVAAATPGGPRSPASAASPSRRTRRPAPRCRRRRRAACRPTPSLARDQRAAVPAELAVDASRAARPSGCRDTAGESSVTPSTSTRTASRARRRVGAEVDGAAGGGRAERQAARRRQLAERQPLEARLSGGAVAVEARRRRHARPRRAHQPAAVGRARRRAGQLADAADARAGERQPLERAAVGLEARPRRWQSPSPPSQCSAGSVASRGAAPRARARAR